MHLKGNSYTLPFLWNSVGTFSSAVNHTTCIFKVSKHRHAGVKFMKKYFIQLYGNCDFQRSWSDLKLVLTFGTPTGFQISAGNTATSALGHPWYLVPWPLIAGWAGGVEARDIDVGILQPYPEENRESQWVIEECCIAVLGTGAEGKFCLLRSRTGGQITPVCVVCHLL